MFGYFEIFNLRSHSGSPLSPSHGKGGVILLRYRSFALQTCRTILEAGLVSISTFFTGLIFVQIDVLLKEITELTIISEINLIFKKLNLCSHFIPIWMMRLNLKLVSNEENYEIKLKSRLSCFRLEKGSLGNNKKYIYKKELIWVWC